VRLLPALHGNCCGETGSALAQKEALDALRQGKGADDSLMTAAMMFNTLVRDGKAIACDDDANTGFQKLY